MAETINASLLPGPEAAARTRRAQGVLLGAWGRASARLSWLASGLGLAQALLYAGFAWCAAGAVAALIAGASPWTWAALAAVCAIMRAGVQWGEARAGFEAGARVRAHVRRAAAHALAARGPGFTERHDSGAVSTALIDGVEKLDGYFSRFLPVSRLAAPAPLMLAGLALWASPAAGLIYLASAPVLVLALALTGIGAAKAARGQMDTLRRMAGRFNDRLQALETLNAFDAAAHERAGLASAAEAFRQRTMAILRAAFLSSGALELIAAAATAGVAIQTALALGGAWPFAVGAGVSAQAGLFALLLAPEVYMPFRRVAAAYHDRADAEAAAEALAPLFEDGADAPPARPAPVILSAPQIRFINAACLYPGGREGLAPLSFTAPAGEITALWGPSGVGKSTALKLLMGYAPLTNGELRLDDRALTAPLAGAAGWVGQRARLFHGSVRENIALFDPGMPGAAILAAAEAAGVMEFAASLPDGLDTRLGEQGAGVSGGQAQRIALARALAADRKLILLDEPTAHLDGDSEQRFVEALRAAARGRTVIIATHSPAVRAVCRHVVSLQVRAQAA
ncbi:MAG: thiol reductant ABC exporter subunit CydD [Alphaproteobacteria bacterium]|nr:thiol reductant ABC exporter subunit CydD [Alphaproteobacteria bacterium]